MNDRTDYYAQYCNFLDDDFLASLGLEEHEMRVLALLTAQVKPERKGYIPNLAIEGLVDDSGTPYTALRALHTLKEKRVIFYGLAEEVPQGSEIDQPAEVVDAVLGAAARYVQQQVPDDARMAPVTMGAELRRKKKFDRYAVLNIEYPVIYTCLNEESKFHEQWNPADISILYAAIRTGKLADALIQMNFTVILEFLNYVQSLVNQPLTVQHIPEDIQAVDEAPPPPPEEKSVAQSEAEKWLADQMNTWEEGNDEVAENERTTSDG